MRRAAALILGTLAGTGMLVGAKVGNASSGNSPTTAATGGVSGIVVVGTPTTATGTAPAGAATSATGPNPRTSPTAAASPKPGTKAPTAAPTATRTTAKPAPTPKPPPKSTAYSASAVISHNRGTLSMTVTMTGSKITKISASESNPTEPNCYRNACNTLTSEALTAQSAKIDSVSNATYTSQAYIAALSAILAKA